MKQQEQFLVTARKWRPLKFSDVIGQEHITRTLLNSIKNERIHHAYLFCGPRGVGKTTTARILARAVNFPELLDKSPEEAGNEIKTAIEGRSLDIIEIDGASNNSVEDVRTLRENAKYPPALGKYKMYIIDEVHMLSTSAFNALLKILEEPPPHLIFVFATTEIHKVPATIISRTQRFDFRRMEIPEIVSRLKYIAEKENIKIEEQALITIAKKADGSMRDSQSIFDQVIAFCGTDVKYSEMADALNLIDEEFFFKITNAIKKKNSREMFEIAESVSKRGYDIKEVLSGLIEHLRNILTVNVTGETKLIEGSSEIIDLYTNDAKHFSKNDLLRLIKIANDTEQSLRFSPQPSVKFELALVNMASMANSIEIENLINEIRSLKKNSNLAAEAGESYYVSSPGEEQQQKQASDNKNNYRDSFYDYLIKKGFESKESPMIIEKSIVDKAGKLLLSPSNDIALEYIRSNEKILSKLANEFFGESKVIELISTVNRDTPKQDNKNQQFETQPENKVINKDSSSEIKTQANAEKDIHPTEKALIDLFGAKKLAT